MRITITKEVYSELVGLYVNVMVFNRFTSELNEEELTNIQEKNKQFADRLDELKVPWKIQNQVAYEAMKRENWSRYNKDVIYEVIDKHNKLEDSKTTI